MSIPKPIPIIIAGPSGVGKNAITKAILKRFDSLERLKTVTSRKPRSTKDVGYHFVSKEEFNRMAKAGELIEWTEIHGNLYGARIKDLEDIINKGKFPVALVDVHGVGVYKKYFPEVIAIFIRYESLDNLPERLKQNRPNITDQEILVRLKTARKEMKTVDEFDYVVVNKEGKMEEAVEEIAEIIEKHLVYSV